MSVMTAAAAPMTEPDAILIPLAMTAPLPINEQEPMRASPLTMAPVEMWVCAPTVTLCSTLAAVLMMQFSPIVAPAFTVA